MFSNRELLFKLEDVEEFYKLLCQVHRKLVLKTSNVSDKCGSYLINGKNAVQYIIKEGKSYVPLLCFEGKTESLVMKPEVMTGWDLSYLKFVCKVLGI